MMVPRLRLTTVRHRIVAVAVALLTGCAVAARVPWPVAAVAVVILALFAAAAHGWSEHALVDAALVSALLWIVIRLPVVGLWPLPAAIALGGAALVAKRRGRLAGWRSWLRSGRLSVTTWALCASIVVPTSAALLIWTHVADGRMPASYAALVRSTPLPMAIGGVFLFLVINGAVEDSVWSGVLLEAQEHAIPTWAAVVVTAASFALAHLHGVPSGPVGVVMVFAWGLVLGALRLRSGGMLATYAAHVLADATIVVALVPGLLTT